MVAHCIGCIMQDSFIIFIKNTFYHIHPSFWRQNRLLFSVY